MRANNYLRDLLVRNNIFHFFKYDILKKMLIAVKIQKTVKILIKDKKYLLYDKIISNFNILEQSYPEEELAFLH